VPDTLFQKHQAIIQGWKKPREISLSEYFRSNMVEALLQYCCDLETEHSLIQDSLSEWEQVITGRAFEDAIRKRRSRR
jgi:hypothetical protein